MEEQKGLGRGEMNIQILVHGFLKMLEEYQIYASMYWRPPWLKVLYPLINGTSPFLGWIKINTDAAILGDLRVRLSWVA